MCLPTRLRSQKKPRNFSRGKPYIFIRIENPKGKKRWQGPGVIIARYGNQYALVHFRGSYLEVALGDLKSTGKVLEVLGCDGTLKLHVGSAKFPIRYLVDSQALIFLSKVRNGYLQRNPTTWANTDTRLPVLDFLRE